MIYKNFDEMPLFKNCLQLIDWIYLITKAFPVSEQYALTRQMKRSVISIAGNFAESFGRYHYADKVRVLYICRGEMEELRCYLMIAKRQNYCTENNYKIIGVYCERMKSDLNKYIKSLITLKHS